MLPVAEEREVEPTFSGEATPEAAAEALHCCERAGSSQ